MATLSLTIFKAKVLKDGLHEIRIAVRHKHETTYIITRFIVAENQFKNGQVVKRPDAAFLNTQLRNGCTSYLTNCCFIPLLMIVLVLDIIMPSVVSPIPFLTFRKRA